MTDRTEPVFDALIAALSEAMPAETIRCGLMLVLQTGMAWERQRCAKIAKEWKFDPLLDHEGNLADLAEAIQNG